MRMLISVIVSVIAVCGGQQAMATETIRYVYDAHGRLVQVQRTGTVNNGVTTAYSHDKADNRTAKVTAGAPN